ncbi:MAG: hypothetical protein ACYC3I_11310 [Gemmataceae bacterium]
MAKQPKPSHALLRWNEYVPASDVQDPLGLNLRGLARLGDRLLYCITSITPRARYFSFLPWCVFDYQNQEKGKPHALGLRDAIVLREKALTLACVAHHEGDTCSGGALVGTLEAKRWLGRGNTEADLKEIKLAKVPALNAYFTSLVNLGCFVTDEETLEGDEEGEEAQFTFDDVELSPLGLELARRYDSVAGGLPVIRQLSGRSRRCSVEALAELGKYGGLCELTEAAAADRTLLRDVFFALADLKGDSHRVRRHSLMLILELCRQFSAEQWVLSEPDFASAVYFGELTTEEGHLKVEIPSTLLDVATRWRMFYFHHYMGVALEGLFSWLIAQLATFGLAGATLEELVARLNDLSVRKGLSDLLHIDVDEPFGELTPCGLFARLGLPNRDFDAQFGTAFDQALRSTQPVAEDTLETLVRNNDFLQSSTGLALPMILLATTLARYSRWEETNYGKWLSSAASDPYLDLVPPVLASRLSRRFGRWWRCNWKELTGFVLSRYVVHQHQAMSYKKTKAGDRCLLQVDGSKVFSTDGFDKIGMDNPRLHSAVQILKDLGLMEDAEDDVTYLTEEGKPFLRDQLKKEPGP